MHINLPAISEEFSLSRYINEINKYPLLSVEEERDLAKKLREEKDVEAAHQLTTSHLRLVVKMAFQMKRYGVALMDLISEGNIGLMHAVKKYDLDLGCRLSTYAMWWIKASMQEFIIRSKSLVKVATTAAKKKLFFSLEKAKKKIQSYNEGRSITEEDTKLLAEKLNVTKQDINEMNGHLNLLDTSLDEQIGDDEGGDAFIDYIQDQRANPEEEVSTRIEQTTNSRLLKESISRLDDRSRAIIEARRLQERPVGLKDLAEHYKISKERVRQIEGRALEKLRFFCLEARC